VEPISTTLAAISLIKGAVSAINGALEAKDDIANVYSGIDKLFHARDQLDHHIKKPPPKPKSKLQNFFNRKLGEDVEDDLSLGAIASLVTEQKRVDRLILNMSIRIDNVYGPNTWQEILDTRDAKLKERAEERAANKIRQREAAEQHKKDQAKFLNVLLQIFYMIMLVGVTYVIGYLIYVNRCTSEVC
jgi:hypothetical protein